MLVPHFCRACPSLADAKQLGGWPEWFMWSWSQAPEIVGRVAAADGPGPTERPPNASSETGLGSTAPKPTFAEHRTSSQRLPRGVGRGQSASW